MIPKPIDDIEYTDIERLVSDKVNEGETLDYKLEIPANDCIIKNVCAFANTRGGDIIFGVRESGDGGPPKEIVGLRDKINKERIEQIVLSNITPRLTIQIKQVDQTVTGTGKIIMIVRVPDSSLKPHCDNHQMRYYKRYQFMSVQMAEQEICDSYKRRFSTYDTVERYIANMNSQETYFPNGITISMIVIPSSIEYRLIDTSNSEKLNWINKIQTKYGRSVYYQLPLSNHKFFGDGIMYETHNHKRILEIHRNGCIQYKLNYERREPNYFDELNIAIELINLLDFSNQVLTHYGYYGETKIVINVNSQHKVSLYLPPEYFAGEKFSNKLHCVVKREHPLQYMAHNIEQISSSIMNDIVNNFDMDRCRFFKENGTVDEDKL